MIKFKLTILGTNAAGPAYGRITSCQVIEIAQQSILIDCGEACQIRLGEYKIKTPKIKVICISHLHGDHIFGLPGLLTSFSSKNRKETLTIIGPAGIKSFVEDVMRHSSSHLSYPLEFKELNHTEGSINIYGSEKYQISAFPLDHRIITFGYRINEVFPSFNVKKEAIDKFNLSVEEIKLIKRGKDPIRTSGEMIDHKKCVKERAEPRSYAYCSDTVYNPRVVQYVRGCQYLYHETTYEHDLVALAKERKHSTSVEAAQIALKAKVEYLITGHYSGRYRTVDHLVQEASEIFEKVIKGYDGLMIEFMKPKSIK